MSNELIIYGGELATVVPEGENYAVSCGTYGTAKLIRDVDFGVIPKTKKPSLYKSGAEKIAMGYGLLQQYSIESKIEQYDPPFFFYNVKCSLVKVVNGQEYVFSCGFGSANTIEKRNGFNGAFDAANGTLKMAQKRALCMAALAISGMSDAFTQDMDNEEFMNSSKAIIDETDPESRITAKQAKRIFALGANVGLNRDQLKDFLASQGITKTSDIKQKDYNAVCDAINGIHAKKDGEQ